MLDDDKGRGSYKCGRCGVPKKGHVCPYQPKVKRRPEEPLPEMKCVSTQVEMDEFMTLRRLNLEIQGLPESYASEPMFEDRVGVEVHGGGGSNAPHHPSQVMVSSGGGGGPAYSQQAPPLAHHPSALPSLKSMNSHSQPTSYSEVGGPYSNSSAVKSGEHVKEEQNNHASKAAETTTKADATVTKAERAATETKAAIETKTAEAATAADEPGNSSNDSKAVENTSQTKTNSTEAVTSPIETKPTTETKTASAETRIDGVKKAVEITTQTDSTVDEKIATTTESIEIESKELSEVTNFLKETESIKEGGHSEPKPDTEIKEEPTEVTAESDSNKRIKLE